VYVPGFVRPLVRFLKLEPNQCRWPIAGEGMHRMLCCGQQIADGGRAPYCRKHHAIAYPPYDERRDPLRWRVGSVARAA
jgi:hypothetical protein